MSSTALVTGSEMRSPGRKGSSLEFSNHSLEFGDHSSKTQSLMLMILTESRGNCLRSKPMDKLMLGTSRYPAAQDTREWLYLGLLLVAGIIGE
jgi:hypothetical protein